MSNKSKGSNAERQLVRLFTECGWRAVRVAGSGVGDDSPCDIVAGKMGRGGFAVEAKSSKKKNIYISKEQIADFLDFALMSGLRPAIAVKFNYQGWHFLSPQQLKDTGKHWAVSLDAAREQGERIDRFLEVISSTNLPTEGTENDDVANVKTPVLAAG